MFATAKDETEVGKIRSVVASLPPASRAGGVGGAGAGGGTTGGSVHAAVMDVLSADSIAHCAAHVEAVLGGDPDRPLVGVVNNAGYCMISPMELTPEADVRRIFELDFWGYVAVVRAFLPLLKRSHGRFINVGSYGSFVNPPLWVPYCAIKAALEGLTRAWRLELMPFGVGMDFFS